MASLTEWESVNPESQTHIYAKQNLTRGLEDIKAKPCRALVFWIESVQEVKMFSCI